MARIKTRGVCLAEQRETRWTFSGWATADAHENTVRPRAYYRSCVGCGVMVLTLADLDDARSFCEAIMANWLRRAGGHANKIDVANVEGDLRAHLWHLYNRWVPSFGDGSGTFTGYASAILSRKVHTFVARDVGDPTGEGRGPKAHSRTTSESYEGLVEQVSGGQGGHSSAHSRLSSRGERGALDFSLGVVGQDPTGDHVASRSWVDGARDRQGAGRHSGGSVETADSVGP